MKKSVKIILHAAFWLFFPLANAFAKWAGAHNSFPGFGSEPKPGFFQILHESFLSLLVPPDMGRPVNDLANLLGIGFNLFFYLVIPIGVFYLFYGWLIPRALKARNLKSKLFPVLFIVLAPLLITFIFNYLTITVAWNFPYWITLTYIVTIVFAISGAIFRILEKWFTAEKMAKEKLQSELALLKNQVNPHFLFNTLNNIDSLIKSNPDKASETLVKLSEILRYMIYDTNAETVPLADEIKYIESYIDLQRIQYPNKELVVFSVTGNPEHIRIAPMLFIPFVENAFKHCSDKNAAQAIRISFSIDNRIVNFACANVFDRMKKITKDHAHGIGLAIIRRRMELIYPGRHFLSINEDHSTFTVALSINA
jgi:two-component system, LytTR family, sensor kinase